MELTISAEVGPDACLSRCEAGDVLIDGSGERFKVRKSWSHEGVDGVWAESEDGHQYRFADDGQRCSVMGGKLVYAGTKRTSIAKIERVAEVSDPFDTEGPYGWT